jgi:uncharacterized protein YecE (DUF72 family)
MKLWAGTSGFSYKEWKGSFYPEDLPGKNMLAFYARQLPAVEINNTFYRLPTPAILKAWAGQVPEDFLFVLKAPRRITHVKRLKDCEEDTEYFLKTARTLEGRLGAVLFQLPPFSRKDAPVLENFLRLIPDDLKAAFEFRHESWSDGDVYGLLKEKDCALCFSDTEDNVQASLVSTSSWGYLRMRRPGYGEAALKEWVEKVATQNWTQAFVFFKHEGEGAGPRLAKRFLELAG